MHMRKSRLLRTAAAVTPVVLITALATTAQAQRVASSTAALTPAQAQALSRHVTDKVIIVLKNQVARIPDTAANTARRTAAVRSLQRGVLSVLRATHARHVKSFSLINALAATVSRGTAKLLAANPSVAEVVRDLPIPVAASPAVKAAKTAAGITPLPGACPPTGQIQLDPEAIERIHAATQSGTGPSAQGLGYTGAGVKVAFIADGVDPNNQDFIRANSQHVFVDYQDFSGTGTNAPTGGGEAFLDASSIAAQGRFTYDVSGYGVGLNVPCDIRILGVAPGASLVGLNVFGSSNFAFNSVFLEAVNYAVTHDHVNVINESFGANPFPDTASLDLIKMADNAAVKAGVTVTVATGDAGPTNTIGSPSTDPNVISAGATTTLRSYAQTGIGGITTPGVKSWIDNNISALSSGGFAQNGRTVDVVAPGDLNWALCTPNLAKFASCGNFANKPSPVELAGGTSEAAPLTAGVAALVIQAYRQAHKGATPSPAVVKQIIVSTAQNIHAPADLQGAGMIDAYQAVLAAASYPGGTTAPTGQAILDSATQLHATGQPGAIEQLNETLTNDGAASVTLGLLSRTLSPYTAVSTQTLSLTNTPTAVTFTVPTGQARLNVSVALVGGVDISLISPGGDLAEFNLPQGTGNYGNAQVANPAPGTWTAEVSSPGATTAVPAQFQASTATLQKFGKLSTNSMTLAPGASQTVTLTATTPAQPGDAFGSLLIDSSASTPAFAAVTSVPVTLRSLVPTPNPTTTFTGTLTGGNGRAPDTGQTAYYQVQIPSGLKALNVGVSTGSAANTMLATLINPAGVAASPAASSVQATSKGKPVLQPERGTQLHVLRPGAGLWTLAVDFFNSVSGTAVSQPFTVTMNDRSVAASESGLPNSASIKLAPGHPVTAKLKITNGGSTPEAYFVDPRLSKRATLKLSAQNTATLTLPNTKGVAPAYLVPSHTTAVRATTSSTASQFFDLSWAFGDPDLFSSIGKTSAVSYSAPVVSPGDWTITPFLVGPTGPNPAKPVPATTSVSATTAAFDTTITSGTGDLWRASVNPKAGFRPLVVGPGKTVTISVTITPKGAAGTKVSGTVYLADSSLIPGLATFNGLPGNFPQGSDVAAFHYSYTIK